MAEEQTAAAPSAPVAAPASAPGEFNEAVLEKVIKESRVHGVVKIGAYQTIKAMEAKTAKVVFLAENCEDETYSSVVRTLAKAQKIPLISISESKTLGEWCGLCKTDKDGEPRKVCAASSACICAYPKTEASDILTNHLQTLVH